MRASLPLLLLLAAPLARAGEEPVPVPAPAPLLLREAVAKGLLEASGADPESYSRVTLRIESRSREPLLLDLGGSHLRPRRGSRCQRLGLGPALTPGSARTDGSGRLLVDLPPGGRAEIRLLTVCLDAGLPAPGNQSFEVAPDPLPPVREKVLRWWMDHPDASQGAVNAAIWQDRETVHVGPGVLEGYETPKGTFGALRGGTSYRLHDGELMARDPDGVARFLGTEIFQALPTENGLYAVGLGANRKPELWRLALTGDAPWGRVAPLDASVRLKQILPLGPDRLCLVTDEGIDLLDTPTGKTGTALGNSRTLDVSARRVGDAGLAVVLRVPSSRAVVASGGTKDVQDVFELWSVDTRSGKEERLKRYWNVESVVAGGAGIFGLTHAGRLRVLEGEDFRNLPATAAWRRVLAVGPEVVWVLGEDGRLAAAHPRSGARLHGGTVEVDGETAVSVDPVTGDLAVVRGPLFRRVRAADGTVEVIGPAAERRAGD